MTEYIILKPKYVNFVIFNVKLDNDRLKVILVVEKIFRRYIMAQIKDLSVKTSIGGILWHKSKI
jgi:hypothetical protein